MTATIFQTSFGAGELAPGLLARVDFQKYKSGASLALNQVVDVRGGLSNRPGTSFVGRSKQTSVVATPAPVAYLLPGTPSFTVPLGIFQLDTVELFGAGGDANYCGGGGGGYTKAINVAVTPGQVIPVNVPAHSPFFTPVYTWFGSLTTYRAASGLAGFTFTPGIGGAATDGIGTIKFSGGDGGSLGGGGGAAGPGGDGAHGGMAVGGTDFTGAGGGASDGGTPGSDGIASGGTGAGGTNGAGASGGDGSGLYPGVGQPGFNDQNRGGGGGGGATASNNPGTTGGNGGQPGGGAGGARFFAVAGAIGGDALIKITWTGGGGGGGGGQGIPAGGCPQIGTTPRLIPFQFSTLQAYVLEFGNEYMRVIMDGGYVLETPKTITGITNATTAVVTSAAHGFLNGDWVFISGVGGMTQVNGNSYIVANKTTDTFELTTLDAIDVDSTAYGVYTSGGTAARYFELAVPYQVGDLRELKYAQSADVLTITHPLYPPADITRTGNAAWTYTVITFAPNIEPPDNVVATHPGSGGDYTYRYVVTSVDQKTQEESRASLVVSIVNVQISSGADAGSYNRISWDPVAGAGYYNVYRQPEVNPSPDYGQLFGYIGTTTGVSLTDQNIAPDFSRTPPQPRNPFLNNTILYWTIVTAGSGYSTGLATVTDADGSDWLGFIEVDGSGAVVAIVTQYGGENYVAPTISAAGGTGLAATATIGPSTGNYPSCVSYFQQRKCFAASTNLPETFWMTQIGNFNNMDVSIPARDSDAITGTIANTQVNAIKFLLPMASGLIMGSSSGAWQVSGGSLGEPVTPSNIVAAPQAFNGSSDVPPIPVNYDILYVQSKSNVVRDLTYNFYVNNYVGADMSVLSNHLFYGFAIEEWAYQDEPTKIVWAIRNDGALLSFTFLKEQEIFAWTHSDTQGYWISVATIPEGDEDAVYLIAQRQIPGQNSGSPVFYVERMQSRQLSRPWTDDTASATNAWFLDCGLSYSFGVPAGCALTAITSIQSDADLFSAGSVGSVIRVDGGVFNVTQFINSKTVLGVWSVLPAGGVGGPFGTLVPDGSWTLTTAVQTVTGLSHLEGSSVMVLSNGSVEGPYTVVNGSITLIEPSDVVVVGLQYVAKGTTMYVDLGGGAPSVAGKRKTLTGTTCYLENSRGLSFSGSGFDNMVELKERTDEAMGQPTRLQTGELRTDIYTDWTVQGQIYWESGYPLPFTLLGLAGEFTFGDNQGGR